MTTLATHTTGANSAVNGTINIAAVATNTAATSIRLQYDTTNHTGSNVAVATATLDVSFDGGTTWNPMKTDGQPLCSVGRDKGYAPPSRLITYVGVIAGTTLTIALAPSGGSLRIGDMVVGPTALTVAMGTYITDFGTGTGGAGTYTVNNSQTVASVAMSSGGGGLCWLQHALPSDGAGNLNRMIRASLTTSASLVTSLQVVEMG
jgi:hypothetical protein